jgi:hypothetical protein
MPVHCALCERSFKAQRHLDQHTRNSSAHKKSNLTQGRPQIQTLPQVNLPPVKPKQRKQPSPRLAPLTYRTRPAESQQALDPNAIASSSHTPHTTTQSNTLQITKPAFSHDVEPRWSVIPESEYTAVLMALSAHCHSPGELKENGYLLHPYNPLDYVNSRKCKRCNGKFLFLIIYLSWIGIGQETNVQSRECTFHPSKRNKWVRFNAQGFMSVNAHSPNLAEPKDAI